MKQMKRYIVIDSRYIITTFLLINPIKIKGTLYNLSKKDNNNSNKILDNKDKLNKFPKIKNIRFNKSDKNFVKTLLTNEMPTLILSNNTTFSTSMLKFTRKLVDNSNSTNTDIDNNNNIDPNNLLVNILIIIILNLTKLG